MINDAISLRGCSPPTGMVPLTMVCPMQQVRLETLMQEKLITPKSKVHPSTSFQINQINKDFCWQVARVQALFQTIYKQGLVTDQDREKLKELSQALKAEKKQLSTLDLNADEISHAKECLTEANALLKETFGLVLAIKKYEHTGKRLDDAASHIVDCTFSPLYAGESLAAIDDVAQALSHLTKLQNLVAHTETDSAANSCLAEMFENDYDELVTLLEDWEEQLLIDIEQEHSYASDHPDELRLQSALAVKLTDLTHRLKKLTTYCKRNPDLGSIGKQLERLVKKIQKTAPKHQLYPVAPLEWGSAEWALLRQQRPRVQQSQFKQLVERFTQPDQWSERTRHLVHAAFVGMQLSQTALDISSQFDYTEKIIEVEKDVALLGTLLSQGEKSGDQKPSIRAVMDLTEGKQLSHEEIHDVLDAYRLHELLQDTPEATHSLEDVLTLFKNETALSDLNWVPRKISTFGNSSSSDLIEQNRSDALVAIEQASEVLAECELSAPQLENVQQQKDVHDYVNLLYKELLKSVEMTPPTTCSLGELAIWKQKVEDQCYAVKTLEEQIAKLMEPLRQAAKRDDLDRFGNKHKNLILQAQLAESLQIPKLQVAVPRGISSDAIIHLLETHAPQVFESWQQLNALFTANPEKTFLQKLEVQELLQKIDKQLADVFAKAGQDEQLFSELVTPEIRKWLQDLKAKGDYLMVRSTGDEDSRQLANAGGNVSRAYVLPTPEAFTQALGDVVRSYFGTPSLQNRINNEANPFAQKLKLAVTAQQLIGEPLGGATNPNDIPISMVLFTSEPLYVGDEKFRVMRISASYGHGEGVVGNLGIASDTALLLVSEVHPDQLYILYDNATKPTRLAPIETPEGVKLGKVLNPSELQERRVLSPELLVRLYHWGVVGEKFFDDYPTDMEIVVKNETIYPVQARPVNRPTMLPTYLDFTKIATLPLSPIQQKMTGEMVVSGKASVLNLTSPDQILYATTLEEAQASFVKDKHQLVLVSQPEPANSHPVVNFSSLGIPCLYIKDAAALEEMRASASQDTPLVVCMQRATINRWDAKRADPQEFIAKGFTVHPAKIAVSLNINFSVDRTAAKPELKNLLLTIREASTPQAALKALKTLRSQPILKDIKVQRRDLQNRLKELPFKPKQVKEAIHSLKEIEQKVTQSMDELEQVLHTAQPEDRLRALFHAKTLEYLLDEYVHRVDPLYQNSVEQIEYQKQLPHRAHLAELLFVGQKAFEPNFSTAWSHFLLKLEPLIKNGKISPSEVHQFKETLVTLDKAGILSTATAFFFPNLWTQPQSLVESLAAYFSQPERILKEINALMPPEDHAMVQQMEQAWQKLKEAFQELPQRFTDVKAYDQAFSDLQDLTKAFHSQVLNFQQISSPIVRLLVLQNMYQLVDLHDHSIKALKMSPQYDDETKMLHFQSMVKAFFTTFEDWTRHLVDQSQIPLHSEWSVDKYLENFKLYFDHPFILLESLLPSTSFNVAAATLGAQTAFNRHLPGSWEDLFTLVHQNLVAALARENKILFPQSRFATAKIPASIKEMLEMPLKMSRPVMQTGLQMTEKEIQVTYQVPLRNHSAQMILKYNKETNAVTLTSHLMGQARGRWHYAVSLARFLDQITLLPLAEPPKLGELGATISWEINSPQQMQKAVKNFERFCLISFEEADLNPMLEELFEEIPPDKTADPTHFLEQLIQHAPFLIHVWTEKLSQEQIQLIEEPLLKLVNQADKIPSLKAHQIVKHLVRNGKAYKIAVDLIESYYIDYLSFERKQELWSDVNSLTVTLINKRKGIEKLVALATDLKLRTLDLAKLLVAEGVGIAAIEKTIPMRIELLETFMDTKQDPDLVRKNLYNYLEGGPDFSLYRAISLLSSFLKNGFELKEIEELIPKFITAKNTGSLFNNRPFFYELIKKGKGIEEITRLIQQPQFHKHQLQTCISTGMALIAKGQKHKEMHQLAKQLLSSDLKDEQIGGRKLMQHLLDNGYNVIHSFR